MSSTAAPPPLRSADPQVGDIGAVVAPDSPFDECLNSILLTVRWIISAATVVAAALVAGLQLSQLGDLSRTATAVALGAYAVAVVAVGWIIFCAARVLVIPGLTISDLADRQARDLRRQVQAGTAAGGVPSPASVTGVPEPTDPLIKELDKRIRELVAGLAGPPGGIDLHVFYQQHMRLLEAWTTVCQGEDARIGARTYRASSPDDPERLKALLDLSSRAADRLIGAARLYEAQAAYRRLRRWLLAAGLALAVAAPTFALATRDDQDEKGRLVTGPTVTRVFLTGDGTTLHEAGIPLACKERELLGTAVGGRYDEPLVVITDPVECRARILVTTEVGIIAVPDLHTGGPTVPTAGPTTTR